MWSGLPQRIEEKIQPEPNSGCWLWLAGIDSHGYGQVVDTNGRGRQAYKVVYEMLIGEVPQGLILDHFHCDNTYCVNPWHLRPTTYRENTLRSKTAICAVFARRTHCKKGHPLSGDNLGSEKRSRARICLACRRANSDYQKEWRQKNKKKCSEYSMRWRRKNVEKAKAYRKRYDAKNREKLNARMREYKRRKRNEQH